MNTHPRPLPWSVALLVALVAMGWSLFRDFDAPWTDQIDANGACWSQSAHNTLRAGLLATAGVPSAFYFGTLPIPPEGFYTHHPPLLSLLLAGLFRVCGEKEWVARLLPVASSLGSVILLWILMKDCLNARAAGFCVLAFASMPMVLRYGRMVNFEPVNLVWMLGALLALLRLERTKSRIWRHLTLAALVLSLWTAWLGYLFVLVLCGYLLLPHRNRDVKLAVKLLVACVISLALFALEVRCVRPDALHDGFAALNYRMAQSGPPVPWREWMGRVGESLAVHIHPALWALAAAGAWLACRSKERAALRGAARVASCFFLMSAIYVVVFRNASSIHDYASFYFTVSFAVMTGVALDAAMRWSERLGKPAFITTTACIFALLGALLVHGEWRTRQLQHPFSILASDQPEPRELIPELGHAIRGAFGDDVAVICNFLPVYGPQLHYYAQHELLPCAFTADEWKEQIADPENAPIGGVICLSQPHADEILAALPPGSRTRLRIQGIPFCFWHPETQAVPPSKSGGG